MSLKIFALNRFGLCVDSQKRGTSVDHHIYTSHYLRFEYGFLHVLRIGFCRDSLLFCCEFPLFSRGFSLFCREFSLFSRGFLCCAMSFLYFPVAFFILPWFSLFWREYPLFCRDFVYVVVTLITLQWFCFSCCDSYGPP